MTLQKKLKIEVTHGLLVRTGWQPPKEDLTTKVKKEGVGGDNNMTATNITKRTMKTNWKRVEQESMRMCERSCQLERSSK